MVLEGGIGVSTDRVAWQEGAGMGEEQELITHIFKHKHKAKHKLQVLRLQNNKWRILL